MALSDVPSRMGWGEAWRMYQILGRDPTSAICAALSGWEYAISREAMATMDLFDLTQAVNSDGKRITRYPRPWPDVNASVIGKTNRSPEEVRAILASRAPGAQPPPKKPRPRDARGRFIAST